MLTQDYSSFQYARLFFLIGKILLNSGNPYISSLVITNKEISLFLETGWALNKDVFDEILSIANIHVLSININTKNMDEYSLSQNYPNPFNPSTNFSYSVPNKTDVRIVVYDLFGKEIKTLVNESKEVGTYNITWNGRDNNNRQVSTGVYFYKMQASGFQKTMKMMLMK